MSQGEGTLQGRLEVRNDRRAIEQAEEVVLAVMNRLGYPKASLFAVRLALHEALSNAFRHGHRNLPPDLPVVVEYKATPDTVELGVMDQGPGYDPTGIPDPRLEENLERGSGRGLFLIHAYMADVRHNEQGNAITMTYHRPATAK
jgi:serine/threonine-protein kinase RsbW